MIIEPTIIAAAISAIGALLAALMSAIGKRLVSFKLKGIEFEIKGETTRPKNYDAESRLTEAREMAVRQDSIALWNKRSNASLTFSQYIIGGILATSFMQNALSKEVVGFLGVLVLVSKLIHQHYRPDVSLRLAQRRAVHLKKLIRKPEDQLFALREGVNTAPSLLDIRQMVSDGLSKIEEDTIEEAEDSTDGKNATHSSTAKKK